MSDIHKQNIIWYNKDITIQGKSIYYSDFYQAGLVYISDLYSETGKLKTFDFWKEKGMKSTHFLRWAGIKSTVSKHLRNRPREAKGLQILETATLTFFDIPLTSITSKIIHENLIEFQYGENVHTPRIIKYVNVEDTEWSTHYLAALTLHRDTKSREF